MRTPSIRLSDNLHQAGKNSEYSIGELAREGIEQAVITDFVGVCWICGEGIHRQNRRSRVGRKHYEEEIAGGREIGWKGSDPLTGGPEFHQQLREFVQREGEQGAIDAYYQTVGKWLAIPAELVDICSRCTGLLEKVKDRRIEPTELPVPYLFRRRDTDSHSRDPVTRRDPILAYAADSAAVHRASYISFQRREGEEVFWWAARDRQRLCKNGADIWRQIALRTHTHRLGWGNPPRPIFKSAVEDAEDFYEKGEPDGFGTNPIGVSRHDPIGEERCSACGDKLEVIGYDASKSDYCSTCFYHTEQCQGCDDGTLQPYISGDFLQVENIELKCEECSCTKTPSEEYRNKFVETYKPVIDELKRVITIAV